ncbi:hypothetical protein BBK14_34090 [Parafrankia soli]|uniref:Uncharacterized protein n=1 Tax=Parafrankia soli TaxID=2599596 RepID=A0A1S1QC38_9ACTN|nr:hypothetical protein [Parafrankia soli]OHV29814.1 hypothetical protein BBK14_34090 [Parafrankia soli]
MSDSRFYVERPDSDGNGFISPIAVIEAAVDPDYPGRSITRMIPQGPPEVVARTPGFMAWPRQFVEVDGPARLLTDDERDTLLAAADTTGRDRP